MCQFDGATLDLGCPLGRQEVSRSTGPIISLGEAQEGIEEGKFGRPEIKDQLDKHLVAEWSEGVSPGKSMVQSILGNLQIALKQLIDHGSGQPIVGEVVPYPNGNFAHRIDIGFETEPFMSGNALFERFGHY